MRHLPAAHRTRSDGREPFGAPPAPGLFLASAVGRALAALTALPIEERDARPLGAAVRAIAGHARASLTLRRLPG